jgi:hypothetical protein
VPLIPVKAGTGFSRIPEALQASADSQRGRLPQEETLAKIPVSPDAQGLRPSNKNPRDRSAALSDPGVAVFRRRIHAYRHR